MYLTYLVVFASFCSFKAVCGCVADGFVAIAIIYGNKKDWEISYNTHITNDVLGHLTEGEVDWVMIQVQEL